MKKVILLLLFIPLFSFGQDYIKLSEIEIDEEMKLVEEIVKDKENQKLIREYLREKGIPDDDYEEAGDSGFVFDTNGHPIWYFLSIGEISLLEGGHPLDDPETKEKYLEIVKSKITTMKIESSLRKNKLNIVIIFSLILLYLSSRKFKFWIKVLILFFTPFISAYALVSIFNEYIDTFGGMILWAVFSLGVIIYILIQFMRESTIGTALGLFLAFKSDDDEKKL